MATSSLFAVIVLALSACDSGYTDPVAYNDDIIAEQTKVYNKLDSLETILNADEIDEDAVDGAFEDAIAQCDASIKKLQDMGAFMGDDAFQQAGIKLFTGLKDLFNKEYQDLYTLYKKPFDEWEDADFDSMYDIWDAIDSGIADAEDPFLDAQDKFADDNNITLY